MTMAYDEVWKALKKELKRRVSHCRPAAELDEQQMLTTVS
jgi:hypothetical protein